MKSFAISNHLSQIYIPEKRPQMKVLDVAAGTGAVGNLLKSAGFVHLDALDPAEKMLEVAKSKDVYQRYFCEYMDGRRIPGIDTGGFNIGLIPLKALPEMVRVVKPGGVMVYAIADKYLELAYRGEFFPLFSRLVEEGVLEKIVHLHLEEGKVSLQGSGPGALYVYRVKVSEMTSSIM